MLDGEQDYVYADRTLLDANGVVMETSSDNGLSRIIVLNATRHGAITPMAFEEVSLICSHVHVTVVHVTVVHVRGIYYVLRVCAITK